MQKYKICKNFKKIANFLFPVKCTCNICRREIFDGNYFCPSCESDLPKNNKAICKHCGRYVFNSEEYCFSCRGRETYFDNARSAFIYKEPVNTLIYRLKYGGQKYIAGIFASYLKNIYYQNFFPCDYVTFAPMTKKSLKKRGYNQAELIAREFCEITNLKLKKLVNKVKETPRQATLSDAKERRNNLDGAFKVINKEDVKDKNIILIDDIMTTGTTVECISKELKKAKAKAVFVLTVASVSLGEEGKNKDKILVKDKK